MDFTDVIRILRWEDDLDYLGGLDVITVILNLENLLAVVREKDVMIGAGSGGKGQKWNITSFEDGGRGH